MKTLKIVFFLVLFATLFASTRNSCAIRRSAEQAGGAAAGSAASVPGSVAPTGPTEEEKAWRRYLAELDAAGRAHQDRLDGLRDDFLLGLGQKGPGRFGTARNAVPGIVHSVSGFKKTSKIVKDLALDKTRGGDRLERRFEAILGPFVRQLVRAQESIRSDCNEYAADVEAEARAYREEIGRLQGKLPKELVLRPDDAALKARIESDRTMLRRYAAKAGETTIAVALEAVFVRSTIAAIRDLVLRIGGKAVAKGTASAVAPLADGPLPIGDAIAVIGFAWTAWDVRELSRVLPREMEGQLRATVDETQRDTLASAARFAREVHDAYAASAAALARTAAEAPGNP